MTVVNHMAVGLLALFTGGFQFQGGVVDAKVAQDMTDLCLDLWVVGDDMHGNAVIVAIYCADMNVVNIINSFDHQNIVPNGIGVYRCFLQKHISNFT